MSDIDQAGRGGMNPRPDPVVDFARAFESGRRLAAPPPRAQPAPVARGRPAAWIDPRVARTATALAGSGAFDRMNAAQRLKAATTNEQLGAILQGLASLRTGAGEPDLAERLSAARHIAVATGLMDPKTISLADVTDEGLSRHLADVRAIAHLLHGGRAPPPPVRGDIEGRHRFEGGDPADPDNWSEI